MTQVTSLVLADGRSDRALLPVCVWAIRHVAPHVDIIEPEFRVHRGSTRDLEPPTGYGVVFVHRDAEAESVEDRHEELGDVCRDRSDVVRLVPVRMTEAWLVWDATAIAAAAGNPSVAPGLSVPPPAQVAGLRDPKAVLDELLVAAVGSGARRRKQVRQRAATLRPTVAENVKDFAPLLTCDAFATFVDELREALRHW